MPARVRAPELPSSPWLNCATPETGGNPCLSLKALRGRIVILDFWTYCCINCLHLLPTLKALEQTYREHLTVIGIHSGKFDQEKSVDSIRQAILRYDIEHPVLVDSDFQVWQQYAVRAWPTLVVIDPQGYVVASLTGEVDRPILETLMAELIQAQASQGTIAPQPLALILEKQRQPLLTPLAFPGKVLADEASDRLFIADSGHHRVVVTTLDGKVLHCIGTGQAGLVDGTLATCQFSGPQGMAFDRPTQQLYVADTENHALRRVDLATQTVTTLAGTGTQSRFLYPHGGLGLDTALNSPWDLVLLGNRLLIAMAGPHQIWEMQLDRGTVQTYVGTGAEACVDGTIATAAFAQPSGLATDGTVLFVADSEASSIRCVRLTAPPQVDTLCGSGDLFGFGDQDGVGAAARLQHCLGVAYGGDRLWVADTYNHKIKQVDPQMGDCRSRLGTGKPGLQNGPAATAQLAEPGGLSATRTHLYIADTNNHVIRRVCLPSLTVETLALPGLCSPTVCLPPD